MLSACRGLLANLGERVYRFGLVGTCNLDPPMVCG